MNSILKNKITESIAPYQFSSGVHIDDIPLDEKEILLNEAISFSAPKKNILYFEGEVPKGVYILKKGKVKVSKLHADGTTHNHSFFTTGELFGYNALLCEEKNPVTVTANEECEFYFIEKTKFLEILNNSPQLTQFFLTSLSKEFTQFVNKVSIFAKKKINERVALFLLLLNEKFKFPGQIADETEINITRSDLAGFAGTTLENLVRTMRQFKDQNYIRTNGKSIFITDFEALHQLSGV